LAELTFGELLSTLGPSLFHGVGDALTAFGGELALLPRRSGYYGFLWASGARASSLRGASKESPSLLQFQYLCVDLGDNATNFHLNTS
jgi:hypothetical protein